MSLSQLDKTLIGALQPLVEYNAIIRVAPFVNTLCLGMHYLLAHRNPADSKHLVGLADWNNTQDLQDHLHQFFITYQTKSVADQLRHLKDIPGFFDSIPVTRFRQRYAFVQADNSFAQTLVNANGGHLNQGLLSEAIDRCGAVAVYTDIHEQAEVLLRTLVEKSIRTRVECISPRNWPRVPRESNEFVVFLYGAPSTAYMASSPDTFLKVTVDDALVATMPEYETHVIWHVPEGKHQFNKYIRVSMEQYHSALFASARSDDESEFQVLTAACKETLSIAHPSFPAQIFATPQSFMRCLRDHHSDAKPAIASA